MRTPAAALLFALAFSAAAVAQSPPAAEPAPAAPTDPNAAVDLGSSVVEALEVVAQPPGPALWKVSKGGSEVVVLGSVKPIAHSLVWDTGRLDRALDGAKVLLIEPKFKFGLFDLVRFKIGGSGKSTTEPGALIEDKLPLKLRERFVGARTASHQDARRYERLKTYVAAFLLVGDYREAAGLSDAKPDSTVQKLAGAHKVKVQPVSEYRVASAVKQAGQISEAAGLACLSDGVDQVQQESDHAQAVGKAWAAGDLKAVKALYGPAPLERCLQQVPNMAVIERGTDDNTRAILNALKTPGKSVAVVDLNFLLRPNGVLDRLKAQGATVSVPPG
jgi:uncharacterized protein YbaP (TraB family)